MSGRANRPWPLKWVAVVIVLVIVPYTIITLRYRKPGHAFEPYQDIKDRANVMRLLNAGFQRVAVDAEIPADAVRIGSPAAVTNAPGGLPKELRDTLVEVPLLPVDIESVRAPATANTLFPYEFLFTCVMPDNKHQLGGAELYVRNNEIVITPDFEKLTGDLISRSKEKAILLTVPAGALKPGQFRVTLVGQKASRTWTLQVH